VKFSRKTFFVVNHLSVTYTNLPTTNLSSKQQLNNKHL